MATDSPVVSTQLASHYSAEIHSWIANGSRCQTAQVAILFTHYGIGEVFVLRGASVCFIHRFIHVEEAGSGTRVR